MRARQQPLRGTQLAPSVSPERLARFRRWWNGLLNAGSLFAYDGPIENRALELLKQNLSSSQREQFDGHRFFDVIGGTTGTRYRIHQAYQMNVEELSAGGKRARLLCFAPQGRLPICDVLLAQKIALECFELEALAVANAILSEPRRWSYLTPP
jgi:hypothetical protein